MDRQHLRHEGEIRLQAEHLPLRIKSKHTVDLQFPVVASRQISFLKLLNTKVTKFKRFQDNSILMKATKILRW